ncbi:hypothetical protein DERP_014959 [Dermatophagoides pteronyssinus]|uniref:Gamma-glutamylcyclotransferase family protein n=1 Tax=Dermatophagoides pteronyssinus TaxID=6956 RepID=A0ABQ8JGD4_DERPT|nr:hypothetical protein DERP_014959 [Dermatophagoides pteronyssinus]
MIPSRKMVDILRKSFANNNDHHLEHLVFVYGTLKKNQPNHPVLFDRKNGQAKFVCIGQTVDRWPLVIASKYNIPYLLYRSNTGHKIKGEIYEIDNEMLKFLDEFEGHPQYYTRRQVSISTIITDNDDNHQQILKPWTYFLDKFRSEMLQLPMYDDYNSYGDHNLRYVERCDRQSGPNLNCGHTEKSEVIID